MTLPRRRAEKVRQERLDAGLVSGRQLRASRRYPHRCGFVRRRRPDPRMPKRAVDVNSPPHVELRRAALRIGECPTPYRVPMKRGGDGSGDAGSVRHGRDSRVDAGEAHLNSLDCRPRSFTGRPGVQGGLPRLSAAERAGSAALSTVTGSRRLRVAITAWTAALNRAACSRARPRLPSTSRSNQPEASHTCGPPGMALT